MRTARLWRLNQRVSRASTARIRAAALCAVCVGVLALLSRIDFAPGGTDASPAGESDPASSSSVAGIRPAEHRKLVFDERRSRFGGEAFELPATDLGRDAATTTIAREIR